MARDRGGDWRGKRWFVCMQNIRPCNAIKLDLTYCAGGSKQLNILAQTINPLKKKRDCFM